MLTDQPLSLYSPGLPFFQVCFLCFFPSFIWVSPLPMSVSQDTSTSDIWLIRPLSRSSLQGERCSFSVQMWFYFLCGLRSDLWALLPAGLAKEVLGQVLSETLQLLVQRYTRARPSYQRHLQIRYLITYRPGGSHAGV